MFYHDSSVIASYRGNSLKIFTTEFTHTKHNKTYLEEVNILCCYHNMIICWNILKLDAWGLKKLLLRPKLPKIKRKELKSLDRIAGTGLENKVAIEEIDTKAVP